MNPDEQLKQDVLLRALDAILGDSRAARIGGLPANDNALADVTAIEAVSPTDEEDPEALR